MSRRKEIEHRLRTLPAVERSHSDEISGQVDAVLRRVHDDLFDPSLNVNAIKTRLRVSDNNISCRFKYEIGISIKRYIEHRRLDAALVLLREGAFTVAEIAQGVGYVHLQTFYAAFMRRFNCSPGSVRAGVPQVDSKVG